MRFVLSGKFILFQQLLAQLFYLLVEELQLQAWFVGGSFVCFLWFDEEKLPEAVGEFILSGKWQSCVKSTFHADTGFLQTIQRDTCCAVV